MPDYYTKEERAAYMRKYRKENPEYRKRQKKNFQQFKEANPNYFLQYNRRWRKENRQQVNKQQRKWAKNNRDSVNQTNYNWYAKHPKVKYAHSIAHNIPLGSKCEDCGTTNNLVRHHPNYNKPKEIITLCKNCHRKRHAKEG